MQLSTEQDLKEINDIWVVRVKVCGPYVSEYKYEYYDNEQEAFDRRLTINEASYRGLIINNDGDRYDTAEEPFKTDPKRLFPVNHI